MGGKAMLLALAERVEAATGPDRGLDGEIAKVLGLIPQDAIIGRQAVYRDKPGGIREFVGNPLTLFTASLDTKLPGEDGGYWEISGPRRYLNIPTPVPNFWRAQVSWIFGASDKFVGWGATEALARRAAALRARAQEAADD